MSEHPLLFRARRDIERAELARTKAQALLDAANKELDRLRNFVEQYEIYCNDEDKDKTQKTRISTRELTDLAVSVIEDAFSPLSIQEILEELYLKDVEVGGENKSANLAAYLSKDNRVRYERGSGWSFVSTEEVSKSDKNSRDALSEVRKRAAMAASNFRGRSTTSDTLDDDIPF